MAPHSGPLSGRRAEAARNDGRILNAARTVFLANPSAPIADVARAAGVGISALYRRYSSKEMLLRELARDGLSRYIADLRSALADPGDPWDVFCACLHRVVDGQSQALAQRLAGTFQPTAELERLAREASYLANELHMRAQDARRRLLPSHLVDAHRRGQDESVVLAGTDLDPVGIADSEPPLRDLRDRVAVALDFELVLDDVAFRA